MQTQARFALGQRYIAAGAGEGFYSVDQVPGNALGAYLDGATVEVFCNAQDATGDTMNGGEIIVHGSSGDATGYAMRGGSIYIERDAGYRCGIHMKEYQQKVPAIVIGGRCGSFLGEYQAGGTIVVLGIGWEDRCPVGNFCGTGMHGGRIYLRTTHLPPDLPAQWWSPRPRRRTSPTCGPWWRNTAAASRWRRSRCSPPTTMCCGPTRKIPTSSSMSTTDGQRKTPGGPSRTAGRLFC